MEGVGVANYASSLEVPRRHFLLTFYGLFSHHLLILTFSLYLASLIPMSGSSSRSQRSTSPFRSRKSPVPSSETIPTRRSTTPSSMTSLRPPSKLSVSLAKCASPTPCPDVTKSKENVTVTVRFRPLRFVNFYSIIVF